MFKVNEGLTPRAICDMFQHVDAVHQYGTRSATQGIRNFYTIKANQQIISFAIGACSRKLGGRAESIRGGRTMPYAIRLSMYSVPFRIVSEWTSILYISMHAAVCPTHMYPTHMPFHTVPHMHTYTFTGHTNKHLYRHVRERHSYLS